jgi:hypothetical protein
MKGASRGYKQRAQASGCKPSEAKIEASKRRERYLLALLGLLFYPCLIFLIVVRPRIVRIPDEAHPCAQRDRNAVQAKQQASKQPRSLVKRKFTVKCQCKHATVSIYIHT